MSAADFDLCSFVAKLEEQHDARVGRSLLGLIKRKPRQGLGLHTALAPHSMDIANTALLGASVERVLASVGLQGCSTIDTHTGKINIDIPAAALENSATQARIETTCAQATQRAHADDLAAER